ncbi:MAG: biotin--[acetyl-CoA-carboxylase] ligase, partial [Proteobacteria bacterium]|nr:biotin--[acetyl-CoA-carboxylase] ligase [Pseudomonadota bacterium]
MQQGIIHDVEFFDEIDSTSFKARKFLATSPLKARAFVAKTQSSGVGRQGRGWISLEGNLHLSVAIPGLLVPEYLRDILPLAVGVVVCEWFTGKVQIAPVLKWPNDIVLDGFKVGGLLCEASITGNVWNGVSIGIGLNLEAAPVLPVTSSYGASSVYAATGRHVPLQQSVDDILTGLYRCLGEDSRDSVLRRYHSYSTAVGQPWTDLQGRSYVQEEFSAEGFLQLINSAGQSKAVRSSENEYSWLGLSAAQVIVADVGNSRVKLGVVRRDGCHWKLFDRFVVGNTANADSADADSAHGEAALEGLVDWLGKYGGPAGQSVVHIASVNGSNQEVLQNSLKRFGWRGRVLNRAPTRFLRSQYDQERIGLDRVALMEASLALRSWGQFTGPLVVVSMGTATTIDFLDSEGGHEGGLIGVGLESGLRALTSRTGSLPVVAPAQNAQWSHPVTTTQLAMSEAAVRMQASWIMGETVEFASRQTLTKRLANGLAHEAVTIVLTGGLAVLV